MTLRGKVMRRRQLSTRVGLVELMLSRANTTLLFVMMACNIEKSVMVYKVNALQLTSPPPQRGSNVILRREEWLKKTFVTSLVSASVWSCDGRPVLAQQTDNDGDTMKSSEPALKVFQTGSGLKYIDLVPGKEDSSTPQYGQLLSIAYKSYITLPGGKPQPYDSVKSYLLKHGNGRTIAGLDEGLHTMKVGGTRRLLIPPKLGYVESGLGPIPEYPWSRWKLNSLLDDMVKVKGGTVVMEVTLLHIVDDEADQGYYSDDSLTPEQFETLKFNIQQKAAAAAAAGSPSSEAPAAS